MNLKLEIRADRKQGQVWTRHAKRCRWLMDRDESLARLFAARYLDSGFKARSMYPRGMCNSNEDRRRGASY